MKVEAHLRIDEHQSAQDGAIRWLDANGNETDLRLSILPTLDGEKIVIRLLAKYVRGFQLVDLGLGEEDQKIIEASAQKPFGMILVVGPTGSGKTTSLYALLKLVNNPTINITTIEDPVEYRIAGVNQIQVNSATGLTFAKGLRSIVRQDPDLILVGEIRDQETSEISINAALTGHLLFSTFHANDAAAAIPRLLDMGTEPFLLASTLELIIAQRLARRICENCRYSVNLQKEEINKIPSYLRNKFDEKTMIYRGKGCSACNFTGYQGRIALFEIIKTSPELQETIMGNPSSQQIWEVSRKQGARSLFEDGLEKVKTGLITLEEVFRVAPPNK